MSIGKKLRAFFVVNLLLVVSLLITSYVVSNIIVSEMYEKTYLDYGKHISKISKNTFNGLKTFVYELSKDRNTYKIIMGDNIEKSKEEQIIENIKYGKGLLIATSFVESIEVIDINSNKIYSSDGYEKDFYVRKRPWYNEAVSKDEYGEKVIVTDVHKNFGDGRYTLSIVSFIKDNNFNKVGCVILNVYIDDLAEYMQDIYDTEGNLKVYIKIKDGQYYSCSDGAIDLNKINNDRNNYIVDKGCVIFSFDKNKTLVNETTKKVNMINLIIFIVFLSVSLILTFIVQRTILKSLLQNVAKLRNTLKALNKYSDDEIYNKNGFDQLDYVVNSFDDAINERVREYILTDSVTGVLNRRGLEQKFDKLVKRDSNMAIIFLDLDKFKNINDVYGHSLGDRYLKEFSDTLKKCLGSRGVVARISGDEFVILYKYFINNEELEAYYRKNIENVFNNTKLVDDKMIVRYSAGASIYPKDGDTLGELIKKSDYIMYTNKAKGANNKLSFFDDKGYEELKNEEAMSIEVQKAIKNDELYILYQPIVDKKENVVKAEALIRWHSKKLGFVPTDKFIRIIEENKDITEIGYWIFERVCKDIKKIRDEGIHDLVINVNISAIQLLEQSFAVNVKNIIDKYNLNYSDINIEITESAVIEDDDFSLDNLNKLREFGFTFSLDDFGTGYTSFAYLKKFKGEFLKIDKSILDDANENNYRIINSIKEIGKELNFKIVIEGVEKEEQFKKLKEIHCDLFQGYYFSKPISLEEFIQYIKKNK